MSDVHTPHAADAGQVPHARVPVSTAHEPARERPDLIVIGAGIAGLAAALTAGEAGRRVLVLDAHPAGGRARTTAHDGFLHNVGPHALYVTGSLSRMLARHGISPTGGRPPEIPAHVLRGGETHRLSLGPGSILRTGLLSPRERLRLLALFARVQRGTPATLVGRSVDEWLASTPARVRAFVDMLIRVSSYTDAPDELDAGSALGQLQLAIGGGVRYLDDGWGSMVTSMLRAIEARGGEVRTGVEVIGVERATAEPHDIAVTTTLGVHRAAAVVIAAGGPDVAARLSGSPVRGADRLTAAVTASVLDLSLARPTPLLAFALDEPLYLSAHAPAARLAPPDRGLVSVMRYRRPGDTAAAEGVRDELRSFAASVGIARDDVLHERWMPRLVVAHGAPTAAGGGLAGRPGTTALGIPGVYVAGDWVGGEGLLADGAAASGVDAATHALRHHASISA